MAYSEELRDKALFMLLPMGPVRPRRMFGGCGLFMDDLMFALIAADGLYFKADDKNRPDFEAAGCARFTYERKGKTASLSYYSAPENSLGDAALLLPWAESALAAAKRAKAK